MGDCVRECNLVAPGNVGYCQAQCTTYCEDVGAAYGKSDVLRGDASTLDSLASFASSMASIVFCVYSALTALNLALGVALACKDYVALYLELPRWT